MTPEINICKNLQLKDGGGGLTESAVKQPVPCLYGIVDLVGTGLIGDLPQTETDLGHFIATRLELDRLDVDHSCGSGCGKSAKGIGKIGYVRGRWRFGDM